MLNTTYALGRQGVGFVRWFGRLTLFQVSLLVASGRAIWRTALIVRQVYAVGVLTLAIIVVSGFFIGMVLALQGYYTLVNYGAEQSLGVLVSLTLIRELGPVVSALLYIGRAGSSITAEIGLMRATEQIASFEMIAVDPNAYIYAPRWLAGIIAVPILSVIFIVVAMFGSHLVGVELLGIDHDSYWSQIKTAVDLSDDIGNSLIKSVLFGTVAMLIALYEGDTCVPTAEGVSRATTRSVVNASLMVLGLDFIATAFMFTAS